MVCLPADGYYMVCPPAGGCYCTVCQGVHCNAQLNAGQVRRICRMTPGAEQLLRSSYDALGLSARAHDRILRVARTVADLAGKTLLDEDSLLEALQYRAQEKLDG